MDNQQALSVIEQALNHATQKGVFGLKDAAVINTAFTIISTVLTPQVSTEEIKPEQPSKKSK